MQPNRKPPQSHPSGKGKMKNAATQTPLAAKEQK
jgi:hypothetical protein